MPNIDSFYRSDVGRQRGNNEDAAAFGEPKDARTLQDNGRLYVVADGLGGHEFGEQASSQAVESLTREYFQSPGQPPEARLRQIIQQVNRDLFAQARQQLEAGQKMATTIVAAVLRDSTLHIAHVGDSRAYLIRDGKAVQLTQDHSFVGEMLRSGAITEQEAQQSKYRNRLTRSVGANAEVEVDVSTPIRLRSGDVLLLCSDGLTQYATTRDLEAACAWGTAQEMVERLIQFANARGGSDNVTVAVVRYGQKPLVPAGLVLKASAAGLAILLLGLTILLGWRWTHGLPPFSRPTATPTASPTATFTHTPEPTLTPTLTPSPAETPTPEFAVTLTTESPATAAPQPSPAPLDCQYTVQPGDTVGKIARAFGVPIAQVFRQDGTQENMRLIRTGEILLIRGISGDACVSEGGIPQPAPQQTPEASPEP
jgi:protein phosphatase